MKFIKDVTTLEELKRVYKKLALKYHPDMGGTDKEMAQINNEYEALFDKLKALNMKWSNNKKSWYLAPDGYKKRSKKKYDMSDIRNMYGSQVVKEEQVKQKTLTA